MVVTCGKSTDVRVDAGNWEERRRSYGIEEYEVVK